MQETKEKQSDFYQILGLTQDATYDEIYEKYLKLSLLYHPDKGGDPEKYKLVNLAYSVLKDPENRRKYNNSLATTFSQFKDETRDTKYHILPDKRFSDPEEFLKEFEGRRHLQEDTAVIDPNQEIAKRDIKSLMADRDNDLFRFQQTQKTELTRSFDPKNRTEEFNHIFNQYKSLAERRELEVFGIQAPEDDAGAPIDHLPGEITSEDISEITRRFQEEFDGREVPQVTSEQACDVEFLEKQAALHREEQNRLTNVDEYGDEIASRFEVNFNDSDKPVLPNGT